MAKANADEELDTSNEAEQSTDDSGDDWDEDGIGFDTEDPDYKSDQEEPTDEKAPASEDSPELEEEDADDQEGSTEDESEEVEESEDTESKDEEEDTTSENEPAVDEKTQKQLAHEAFKRREAERKLREAEQKRERDDLTRYLDEAKDDDDELAKRQLEVNTYVLNKERSEVLSDKLDVSMQKAVLDLGLKNMDEATQNYVARRLDEFEATRVIKDQRGNIVQVKGDVYQYLKQEMDSISQFKSVGAREQTTKKAKERASVMPKPTRTPKEPKIDPDLEAFDEEANRW